mgnify:CR=1 FL=1|tara:strand:- start:5380 stop:6243 length:864 start_codon:yes stop_codon:yes gene_type:complete
MFTRIIPAVLAMTAAAFAAPVNTVCPLMPDEAITDSDNVIEYDGKEVAFCCGRCVRKWNGMDDAKRQEMLVAVMPASTVPVVEAPETPEEVVVPMDQLDPLGLCPKSGSDAGAMGKATRRVINGVDVTFCCPPCIKPYEDDYAEYRRKIDGQIVVLELPYYPTDKCIVSGKELGKETTPVNYVLGNRLVRVGTTECIEKLKADPASYNRKLDEMIIKAERKDYPLTTCIVGGRELDPDRKPFEVVVGNRLMKLCCGGCQAQIRETPYVFVKKINEAWAAEDGDESGS